MCPLGYETMEAYIVFGVLFLQQLYAIFKYIPFFGRQIFY
jgi:hypothetical protein